MKKYSKNLIPEAETQIVGRRPSTVTPIFYLMQSVWNVIICVHQWPQWTYLIRAENNLLQMFTFCKVNVCLSSCQLSQAKPWRDHQSIAGLTQRDRPVLALVHTSEPVRFFLDSPATLTFMSLEWIKKLEYPAILHAGTGRTCSLHTEKPQRVPTVRWWC